jgi:hypothetical protein
MNFDELPQFVDRDMRMSHVLRGLLRRNGRAAVADLARALLNEDRSQIVLFRDHKKHGRARVDQPERREARWR